MKRTFIQLPGTCVAFCIILLATACSKHDLHSTTIDTSSANPSATSARDQFNIFTLFNNISNSAAILAAEMSPSTTSNQKAPAGYKFNGAELGKPDDLFCGVTITGSEDPENYLVNIGYNGPDCSGLFNCKGTVVIRVPKLIDWKLLNQGYGWFFIDFNHLNVTRIADQQHVCLSGTLMVYNEGNYYSTDPNRVISVDTLIQRKDSNIYVTQQLLNYSFSEPAMIHYDDSTVTQFTTQWYRTYRWKDQLVIDEYGSAKGTDHNGRPFHWTNPLNLIHYQNCNYKLSAGQLTLIYDDANPHHDSSSVIFGVDEAGTPASPTVQQGDACLDRFYCHFLAWNNGRKTIDLLFPE